LLDAMMRSAATDAWSAIRGAGKIRNIGAQAIHLCGVASGWFAAALSLEAAIWDEAAAGLILREAGGVWKSTADTVDWTDPAAILAGQRQKSVACHPALAGDPLSSVIKLF
jgi:myo-inositol-1(or 4)-monophosphatase